MRKIILTAAMAATLMALTACETVKGVGRDITGAGEALDNAF